MTTPRPMKELSMDERKQILLDLQVMRSRDVRAKWNITNTTVSHIRFFHGKSNATAGGYYHKDLLGDAVNPIVAQIRELKETGLRSTEVAERLGMDLAVVNKNWSIV